MGNYDEDYDDDEPETEGDGSKPGPEFKSPDFKVPSILFYYSESHDCVRYYQSIGSGHKPEFTKLKIEATVFTNLDHLKLAGGMMRRCGYRGLTLGDVGEDGVPL